MYIIEVSHIFLGAVKSRPFRFGWSPKPRLAVVLRKSIYQKCTLVHIIASASQIPSENAINVGI